MIGAMNCRMPTTVSVVRRAPAEKNRSGTAVTAPASRSRTVCPVPSRPIVSPEVTPTRTSWRTAIGTSQKDSRVRPLTASTDGPIFFLTRPYVAKLAARASAIQGTRPTATMITTTATPAMPTATHCAVRRRSFSTMTPRSTVAIGLMK